MIKSWKRKKGCGVIRVVGEVGGKDLALFMMIERQKNCREQMTGDFALCMMIERHKDCRSYKAHEN